jgi:hypothetical protein
MGSREEQKVLLGGAELLGGGWQVVRRSGVVRRMDASEIYF